MIEVKHLTKIFDGHPAIDDVSISFTAGKCNMVIGASGSGKTVLLKNIMGLLVPDSGQVLYEGRDLNKMSLKDRKVLNREMGVLFQSNALFDFATVEENITFPLEFFSDISGAEKHDRADMLLERVGLSGANRKYPSELSGGMQKRVGIARALALNPKYLFCDEPNSGLDPVTSVRIDELIAGITEEYDMTTVINTHDMNSIMGIGDCIYFIYEGKLRWSGDRESLLHPGCEELETFVSANVRVGKILRN